jgi:hypothetical protein
MYGWLRVKVMNGNIRVDERRPEKGEKEPEILF